jgi:hypothetical protein
MLAIKAEIVSEPVDIDTPCVFIARTVNRNTRDSLIVATIYRPINNDVDYAKALYIRYSQVGFHCLLYLDLARFRNQIECLGCSSQGGSIGPLVCF